MGADIETEDIGDCGMPGNSFIRWAGEKAAWAAEWSNCDPGDTEEAEAGSAEPETRESGYHMQRVTSGERGGGCTAITNITTEIWTSLVKI